MEHRLWEYQFLIFWTWLLFTNILWLLSWHMGSGLLLLSILMPFIIIDILYIWVIPQISHIHLWSTSLYKIIWAYLFFLYFHKLYLIIFFPLPQLLPNISPFFPTELRVSFTKQSKTKLNYTPHVFQSNKQLMESVILSLNFFFGRTVSSLPWEYEVAYIPWYNSQLMRKKGDRSWFCWVSGSKLYFHTALAKSIMDNRTASLPAPISITFSIAFSPVVWEPL